MTKHSFSRIHPLLAAVAIVGAFFVVLFGAYGITRAASQEQVMGRVEVAGTELGGLTGALLIGWLFLVRFLAPAIVVVILLQSIGILDADELFHDLMN